MQELKNEYVRYHAEDALESWCINVCVLQEFASLVHFLVVPDHLGGGGLHTWDETVRQASHSPCL